MSDKTTFATYRPRFSVGDRVRHVKYGWETVILVSDHPIWPDDDSRITLSFRAKGRKPGTFVEAFGHPDDFELVPA